MVTALAWLLAVLLQVGQASATSEALEADPAPLTLSARYTSRVLAIPVGEIRMSAQLSEAGYGARANIRAAGLAALFTDFDIDAEVVGRYSGGAPQPERYAHRERTGDKVRHVDVRFPGQVATSEADPPFGSLGEPPASREERAGSLDPMTAFFQLSDMMLHAGGAVCEGRIPVFDGKQRYDLRLASAGRQRIRTRAWRGEAVLCEAWYEPISGYDPEDMPSARELRHPLRIWLAPLADGEIHFPVRLHTRAGLGGVTIEAVEISRR